MRCLFIKERVSMINKFLRKIRRKIGLSLARHFKNIQTFRYKLAKSIIIFEAILSIFLIIGVFIGLIHLARFLVHFSSANIDQVFSAFYDFLDKLLLLIIGLELIIMLVRHNASSVIEVLIFAIAREILVRSPSMVEISIGVVALAGILAIRKYLITDDLGDEYFGYILGAAVDVEDVNQLMHIGLPLEKAKTLGGFVVQLAKDRDKRIRTGITLHYRNIEFEILEMREGIVEKVRVVKTN